MDAQITAKMGTSSPQLCIARSEELTFSDFCRIKDIAPEALNSMLGILKGAGLQRSGPDIFIYTFHDDPGQRESRVRNGGFRLDIAVPLDVHSSMPDLPGLQIIPRFAFLATMTHTFDDWATLRDSAGRLGLKRTLVEREVYHDWRGWGSTHNRIELQIGIEAGAG